MRRLLCALALALALPAAAGADVFRVLPTPQPELWRQAGAAYGIPWQVLGAINRIESNYGANVGPSSAGAIGPMQFLPATWSRYGVDADGDGVADPWDTQDSIFSAARYLAAAGGATDLPRAVYAYNHAQWYVDDVLRLATQLGNAPAAPTVFAVYDGGGYAFPVGGGPGLVSVARTHHDYPAADIAAPAGSPVYALADSVVREVYSGDARCGTGLELATSDERRWTYCHLAALDPVVAVGAALAAGMRVGLVGATGDATGPHLHLQLDPATAYPQDEPWFRAYAGSAFSWSGAGVVYFSTG